MNTDDGSKSMNADLTREIIGCAFEVINELGHGLHEKPYANSLVVEFTLKKIAYAQQQEFPVLYKKVEVGKLIPGLIVYNAIVVDTKVIERITDQERGQMLNYLKITGLTVGLIINFKRPKLEWERIVL